MGYPTVIAKNATGAVVMTAEQKPYGMLGGVIGVPIPKAILAPGLPAAAELEGSDLPRTGSECVTIATLVITPPGTNGGVVVANRFPTGHGVPGCVPIKVHPVLPGVHHTDAPTGLTSSGLAA